MKMNKTQSCFPLALDYLVRLRRDSHHTPPFVRRGAVREQRGVRRHRRQPGRAGLQTCRCKRQRLGTRGWRTWNGTRCFLRLYWDDLGGGAIYEADVKLNVSNVKHLPAEMGSNGNFSGICTLLEYLLF